MLDDLKSCGTCSMCCLIMGVSSIKKRRSVWCQHVKKGTCGSCGIYERRPQECQEYECVWLMSQTESKALPAELRPDKCGAVINCTKAGDGIVIELHPNRPVDWQGKDTPLGRYIRWLVEYGELKVLVRKGARTIVPYKDGVIFEYVDRRYRDVVDGIIEDTETTEIEIPD